MLLVESVIYQYNGRPLVSVVGTTKCFIGYCIIIIFK